MAKEFSRLYLLVPEIKELISRKDKETLKSIFYDYEPVEVAQVLKKFNLKEKAFLFSLWNIDFAADVFEKMNKKNQLTLLRSIDRIRKGIALGLSLGIFAFIRAIIFQKSPFLGLTVGLTMITTVTVSTSLGSVLPLICKSLNVDPAVVSGPLITTIVDITTLLIYFGIAECFFFL